MFKKILITILIFISLAMNSFAVPPEVAKQFVGKSVNVYVLVPFFAQGSYWETETQGIIKKVAIENNKYYVYLKVNPSEIYKLDITKITRIEKVK